MADESRSRVLLALGAFLFLLGLLTGVLVPAVRNARLGLSAHLEGVMNGTFLMVLGAIWHHVHLSSSLSRFASGRSSTEPSRTGSSRFSAVLWCRLDDANRRRWHDCSAVAGNLCWPWPCDPLASHGSRVWASDVGSRPANVVKQVLPPPNEALQLVRHSAFQPIRDNLLGRTLGAQWSLAALYRAAERRTVRQPPKGRIDPSRGTFAPNVSSLSSAASSRRRPSLASPPSSTRARRSPG